MPEAKESEKVVPSLSEDNFEDEFFQIFLEELNEFLGIYEEALDNIQNNLKDRASNYKEIFRVYHTLKGDTAFFPKYDKLTNLISLKCELLRELDPIHYDNAKLIHNLGFNLTRLSLFYMALKNDESIDKLNYKIYFDL